jgi:flagellar protein FlaG
MDDITLNGGIHQRAGVQDLIRAQEERPAVAPPEPTDTGSSDDQGGAAGQQQQDRADRVLRNAFANENIRLKIEVDKETGDFIYLGIDSETGEVVKQYPPDEIVRRVKHYRDVAGLAVDTKL